MKEFKIITGLRTVSSVGTAERINEELSKLKALVISVTIRALTSNAGLLYIGSKPETAKAAYAYYLSPGETLTLDVHDFFDGYIDLQHIWFDAANAADGLTYHAYEVV